MTEQEFREAVERSHRGGLSLVAAIYKVSDQLTSQATRDQGIVWVCHKGCDFCCHQLVTATQIEWQEIRSQFLAIRDQTQLYRLKRSLQPTRRIWRAEFVKGGPFSQGTEEYTRWMYRKWQGRPCPFLSDEGVCTIYKVRPIDCRTMYSTVACTSWESQEGVKRFPFEWHRYANNMVVDEQERLTKPMVLAPLIYWVSEHLELLK